MKKCEKIAILPKISVGKFALKFRIVTENI